MGTKTKQLDYSYSSLRILHSIEPNLIETTGKNEEGHVVKTIILFLKRHNLHTTTGKENVLVIVE